MTFKPAMLVLADGTVLKGRSIGAVGTVCAELVFNTAMTGYQEILTDPSYAQQIVMLTVAHVGNTGCNSEDNESTKVWASGLVLRDCPVLHSNYRAQWSLPEWLRKNNVIAISDIDTRFLTRHLRDNGAMSACLTSEFEDAKDIQRQLKAFAGLDGVDLAQEVTRQTQERWHEGRGEWGAMPVPQRFHIVAYDFGIKHNILRILFDLGCHITIVPAKTSAEEVFAMQPDGVFLSNGPGDPKACDDAIHNAGLIINSGIPVFGICLGFQIIALACGARSLKMKFGHHGANHPVQAVSGNQPVFISSQNHGFAIDEDSLPEYLEVSHRSLFDKSLQGIRHKTLPVMGFQGHPEASPGPHDLQGLFSLFIDDMQVYVNRKQSNTNRTLLNNVVE